MGIAAVFAKICGAGAVWLNSKVPYVLQGCGRAVYESTNRGIFADFFPGEKANGAFANQMLQSTLSFTLCFFFSAALPIPVLAAIIFALAGIAFPAYILATRISTEFVKVDGES